MVVDPGSRRAIGIDGQVRGAPHHATRSWITPTRQVADETEKWPTCPDRSLEPRSPTTRLPTEAPGSSWCSYLSVKIRSDDVSPFSSLIRGNMCCALVRTYSSAVPNQPQPPTHLPCPGWAAINRGRGRQYTSLWRAGPDVYHRRPFHPPIPQASSALLVTLPFTTYHIMPSVR